VGSNSPVCVGQNINLNSNAVNAPPCAGGTFTVNVSGGGYGDETSWQLRDASNAIILSGGPYFTFGWSQTASVASTNGPFKFSMETQGFFNDNSASWAVSCSGPAIVSGFIGGGQSQNSACFCCTGVVDCPSGGSSTYCTPVYTSFDGTDFISNVTLNTINNSTGNAPLPGYTDYTAISTTLFPGTTYNISVTSGSFPSSEGVSAFIDFNKDGVFDAVTERLFNTVVTSSSFQVISNSFTVPAGATSGNTRLRVVLNYAVNPAMPCPTFSYGETEDYTIIIGGGVVAGYAWTGPNSFVSAVQNPTLPASQAAEGSYTVTYTAPNGCTTSASTDVVVNEVPVISSLQSATLNGGAAISFPAPPTFLDIPVFTETLTCDKVVNYTVNITGDPDPAEVVGGIAYSFSGATSGSGNGTGTGSAFGRLIPTGRTTVTVTATNVCGSQSKQFRVTVTDNVAPVITPIEVPATNTNGGDCSSLVQVTQPDLSNGGLFDNCPNASLIFVDRSDGRTQFESYFAGTTTVTWQATDASGNMSTATQDVVVNNIKPVITSFISNSGNVIFTNQSTTFTTEFTDEDGGGTHTVKFYRDKNDAIPADTKVVGPNCTQSCSGVRSYSVTSELILFSTSMVSEPKVEVLDGCNTAADQQPGLSTIQYFAVAVAGQQFTTGGGHFTMPAGGFPSTYEGFQVNIGNVVKKANSGPSFKGQLEMNVHIPNQTDWRVHTDNGTNADITWDYLTIGGCSLATFKGAVRINGQTGFKVLVQQSDKDRNPATSNFIRVKVTTNGGAVVFDTQPGLTEALTSGNGGAAAIIVVLDGGSIKVQPSNTQNQACESRIEGSSLAGDALVNIPNPFTGQTEIRFSVPEDGKYTLVVYNYLGQEVTTLFNGEAAAGSMYSVMFDGSNLEGGIYTYTLRSANVSETRRMNLVK